jgi:hypothetical protein
MRIRSSIHPQSPLIRRTLPRWIALSLFPLAAGCAPRAALPLRPSAHLYLGFDRSRSAQAWLSDFVAAGCRLVLRMDPDRDRLTLYRVERVTEPFFDNAPPASSERLQEIIIPEMKNAPRADRTFPALFLQHVVRAAESGSELILVGFYWDGGNDDLSAQGQRRYRDTIRRLAANSRVVGVGLFGVQRENWSSVQADFAPLGDRLEIHSPRDMDPDSLVEKLNRRHASAALAKVKGEGRPAS